MHYFTMAKKGYKSITIPVALWRRLEAMRKGERRSGIPSCIEHLLDLTIW